MAPQQEIASLRQLDAVGEKEFEQRQAEEILQLLDAPKSKAVKQEIEIEEQPLRALQPLPLDVREQQFSDGTEAPPLARSISFDLLQGFEDNDCAGFGLEASPVDVHQAATFDQVMAREDFSLHAQPSPFPEQEQYEQEQQQYDQYNEEQLQQQPGEELSAAAVQGSPRPGNPDPQLVWSCPSIEPRLAPRVAPAGLARELNTTKQEPQWDQAPTDMDFFAAPMAPAMQPAPAQVMVVQQPAGSLTTMPLQPMAAQPSQLLCKPNNSSNKPSKKRKAPVNKSSTKGKWKKRKALTSMVIFEKFVKRTELPDGNVEVDCSGMLTRPCFEMWIASRKRKLAVPEEAFRKALVARVTISDNGSTPFPEDVEAALLVELRKRRVWPCFEGRCYENGKPILIGSHGLRAFGYHERRERDGVQQDEEC